MKCKDVVNLDLDVAIIGMSCRFPGEVNNPQEFFDFLLEEGDGIVEVPKDRWEIDAYYDEDTSKHTKMYVRKGGFIKNEDKFDPTFFGISPKEAPYIDPQHRWLIELAYEAIENAGVKPSELRGSDTAVYVGQFMHDYEQILLDSNSHKLITGHSATGPSMTLTANRISYLFDLTGPSVSLDTACSSSLVALDLACKAIIAGDSKMAIAGGVNILLRPELTMSICAASMLSPDGHCKSFDASANGYVRSEGAGLVLVKSLKEAIKDGDPIHAIIKATGCNQDGQTQGITVPNGNSQKKLLQSSLAKAKLSPEDIQYAEAHGTGTAVGDPIEVNALGSLLGNRSEVSERCVIGSVKSNIGHMESAAGVAGLMKSVLAMQAGTIPANINLNVVNPAIDSEKLGIELAANKMAWPATFGKPRRSVVNSFGFGGTNANAILQEAPAKAFIQQDQKPVINSQLKMLTLSAKTEKALVDFAKKYQEYFSNENSPSDELSLHNICYTAATRRDHYKHRLCVTGNNFEEISEQLRLYVESENTPRLWSDTDAGIKNPKTCFVFSGMGTQWTEMGKELYESEPVFREALEKCDTALQAYTGWSLLEKLYHSDSPEDIHETHIAQPGIFSVQVALCALLESWGIKPEGIVGHSAGEVGAAYVSGALNFEDAVKVVYHRSRLQHTTEGMGKMLAVGVNEESVQAYLNEFSGKVSIGAINSEDALTLSGDADALEEIALRLDDEGVFTRFLKVGVPYHSPVMDQLKEPLIESLISLEPRKPIIPIYSTVSGKLSVIGDWGAEYWADNVREPVYFKAAIDQIIQDDYTVFIEIAPHVALTSSVEKNLIAQNKKGALITTLKRGHNAVEKVFEALANLHNQVGLVDWNKLYPNGGEVVLLPNYPWQHESYWCEAEEVRHTRLKNSSFRGAFEKPEHPLLGGELKSIQKLWQNALELSELEFLCGHKVGSDIVYPGAAYVEMLLAASASLNPSDSSENQFELKNVFFHDALYLDESTPTIVESSYDANAQKLLISAFTDNSWKVHSSGVLNNISSTTRPNKLDLDILKESSEKHFDHSSFYAHSERIGLGYEELFKSVQSVWVCGENALAEIHVPFEVDSDFESYFLHPAILDGAFQTFFGTVSHGYLPVKIERFRYYGKPSQHFYCYFVTHEKTPFWGVGDLFICDEKGDVLVEISNMEVQAFQRSDEASDSSLMYDFDWEFLGEFDDFDVAQMEVKQEWIVFSDSAYKCGALCDTLSEMGNRVTTIQQRDFIKSDSVGNAVVSDESWGKIAQTLKENTGAKGILFFWNIFDELLDEKSGEEICNSSQALALQMLKFVQCIDAVDWKESISIFLFSQYANPLGVSNKKVMPLQSQMCGFGRVFASEYSNYDITLFDLVLDGLDERASKVIGSFIVNENYYQELAITEESIFTNRLRRLQSPDLESYAEKEVCLSESDSYKLVPKREKSSFNAQRQPLSLNSPYLVKTLNLSLTQKQLTAALDDGEFGCFLGFGELVEKDTGSQIRKVAFIKKGSVCSRYCLNEDEFVFMPDAVDLGKLTFAVEAEMIGIYALEKMLSLDSDCRIFVHRADSDLGHSVLRKASELGVKTVVTVSNLQSEKMLFSEYGCECVNLSEHGFEKKLRAQDKFDVVISNDKGEFPENCDEMIAEFGHVLHINPNSKSKDLFIGRYCSQHYLNYSVLLENQPEECLRIISSIGNRAVNLNSVYSADRDESDLSERKGFMKRKVESLLSEEGMQSIDETSILLDFTNPEFKGVDFVDANTVKPNQSYLVTGGLGGLGLQIMDWLSDHGATSIVLVGRRSPSPEAMKRIERVQLKNTRVTVLKGDISKMDDVENIVNTILKDMPPLKGIIHSAGVLDDGVINQQMPEKFKKVLLPKVQGAWNLHLATLTLDLDMFVCFSSIAAVVGWAGQSNYATGNAFMDGLVHYRHSLGLPGLSVNWGPWAESGMAANLDERDIQRMKESGMMPLAPESGLKSLDILLAHRVPQAGVFDLDWEQIGKNTLEPETKTLLKNLLPKSNKDEEANFFELLLKAPLDIRETMLARRISEMLASVLGLDAGTAIDIHTNVFDYGINSLMSMELKNTLQTVVKVKLSGKFVPENPTVAEMVSCVLEKVSDRGDFEDQPSVTEKTFFVGQVPLTSAQIRFFQEHPIFTQWAFAANYFRTSENYDYDILNKAMNEVIKHHDPLRARFSQENGEWIKTYVPYKDEENVAVLDWHTVQEEDLDEEIRKYCCERSVEHSLEKDPHIKIIAIDLGEYRETVMLFMIHHLVTDGFTIKILLQDLQVAYQQLLQGELVDLAPVAISTNDWVSKIADITNSGVLDIDLNYWRSLPWDKLNQLPFDIPELKGDRRVRSVEIVFDKLEKSVTQKLVRQLPKQIGNSTLEILLSSVSVLLSRWTESSIVSMSTIDSGRNILPGLLDADLTRTAGWFSLIRPVVVDVIDSNDVLQSISHFCEQYNSAPHSGLGLPLLASYHKDKALREELNSIPEPSVWVNYSSNPISNDKLGMIPVKGYTWVHPENKAPWQISLVINNVNDELQMEWLYNGSAFKSETISKLAKAYSSLLSEWVSALDSQVFKASEYTA